MPDDFFSQRRDLAHQEYRTGLVVNDLVANNSLTLYNNSDNGIFHGIDSYARYRTLAIAGSLRPIDNRMGVTGRPAADVTSAVPSAPPP